MMTVQEIKQAIETLSLSERAELERLLHGWEDDEWDRQMIADAKSGKLGQLLKKVDALGLVEHSGEQVAVEDEAAEGGEDGQGSLDG
jgi:hypothetical protein